MVLQALCIISWPSLNLNLSYRPETLNSGQNSQYFGPCDLEIWQMTLKNNRTPLLHHFKLCASFIAICELKLELRHANAQIGAKFVLTSVALAFDLWSWPFAWTSLLSMVITPENFMKIWWGQHSEKGVTDGQINRQMDWTIHRAAWSQLRTKEIAVCWSSYFVKKNQGWTTTHITLIVIMLKFPEYGITSNDSK